MNFSLSSVPCVGVYGILSTEQCFHRHMVRFVSRFSFLTEGNNSGTGILPLGFHQRKTSEGTVPGVGRPSNSSG